ncbi:YbjN domain-containing protein [Myxococcota bacterium]|nr:YbjN domain-containing protein [Myxococcota bacterium]MBU1382079.1 YbjN domain-containing protein [Myxococcota bacterium]MBU1496193.1 YbjN domain-containing protein [Myxococcota bacterium]
MSNVMESPGIALVNKYLKKFGESVNATFRPLDENGYTFVKRGSAIVTINVFESHKIIVFLAPIMDVPETRQLELFRKLLELNFLVTEDASFAIDNRSEPNKVFLRALRGIEGLDYEEFHDILRTVARVADEWDNKLQDMFSR